MFDLFGVLNIVWDHGVEKDSSSARTGTKKPPQLRGGFVGRTIFFLLWKTARVTNSISISQIPRKPPPRIFLSS